MRKEVKITINLTGAELLVSILKRQGVETIFCITGAGNLAIVDAIVRDESINLVFSHHEQSAVMEAQGYSRISGKLGVALVTTGGGTSNVVTGVLSAYLDSIPVLIISGNESSFHCKNEFKLRAYGVQGFDSVEVLRPITKNAIRVIDLVDAEQIFSDAIGLALSARMGPVHIDFPLDLQRKTTESSLAHVKYSEKNPYNKESINSFAEILVPALKCSTKPIIYIGNGCRNPVTLALVQKFIEYTKIPFLLSWSAIDLMPDNHPQNMGRIGIYGDRAANIALQKSDILICLGTRLAIPQIGYDKKDFARNASKWIVEIDPSECRKFEDTDWNILNANVQDFLTTYFEIESTAKSSLPSWDKWIADFLNIWTRFPRLDQTGLTLIESDQYIHSAVAIKAINTNANNDAIFCTDVGAGLLTGHYIFAKRGSQRLFTSQGLGEMGFGLPGAIGAHFADKSRQIICLNTDGAMMFNLQELQVVAQHKIPLKLFVFNNDGYSMIKISQQNLFESRFAGSTLESGISFPSFEKLSETFNFKYNKITNLNDLDLALKQDLNTTQAVLFEIIMSPDQKYLPRLSTSKLKDGTLVSPPLEDLDPLIPIEVLRDVLEVEPHINSYRSRKQ